MVLSNPGDRVGRLLAGWTAADIDERESLEETAIVERLGRFVFVENSHAGYVSTGYASEEIQVQFVSGIEIKCL